MKKTFVKINNSQNLIRDTKSHAVINTDSSELEKIIAQRAKRKQDSQDLITLKNDVEILKETVKKLLEKGDK